MPMIKLSCAKRCPRLVKLPFYGILAVVFLLSFSIGFYLWNAYRYPMVSVVMPTYNRADLLKRSIESVLNQTYRNFEFIIVDDGSTDESVALIKSYAQNDRRIKLLINDKNRGISYSRNRGNAAARGTYIMIMDSDDISMPNRMARQVEFMQNHPEFVLSTSWRVKIGEENKVHPSVRNMEPHYLFGMYAGHGEWMLRRSFLTARDIRYDEARLSSEDYDYLRQILTNHGKIGYIDEALYLRRVHRTNPESYYRAQRANAYDTSSTFLRQYGVPEEMIARRRTCEIFDFVVQANKEKNYLAQELLEIAHQKCQTAGN